jgi:AraC family transcriptional activator of pobA
MKSIIEGIIPSYQINELKNSPGVEKDFEFYRFENFASDIDHLKVPHKHDHYAIYFILSGSGKHTIDFLDYDLIPNRMFFLSAGQVHSWKGEINARGFVLLFNAAYFNTSQQSRQLRDFIFFNTLQPQPFTDIIPEKIKHFAQLFLNIEEDHVQNNNHKNIIIRSYLTILLYELVRLYGNSITISKTQAASIIKINEFIKQVSLNFKEMKTVADYAEKLNISPNYLNSICKKVRDKSASEIIQDRLLLEAKRLLIHSDKTVAEIWYCLGFEDNSYFGRFFKNHLGQTPANFRNHTR